MTILVVTDNNPNPNNNKIIGKVENHLFHHTKIFFRKELS